MVASVARYVLAYDAHCGVCSRFKGIVDLLDARERIEFVPLEEADRAGLIAGIEPPCRYASFHLIGPDAWSLDSDVLSGSRALLLLIRLLSPWGAISRIVEAVPGSEAAAFLLYTALSKLHRRCSVSLSVEPRGLSGQR